MSDDATLEAELEALLQREWFDPPEEFVARRADQRPLRPRGRRARPGRLVGGAGAGARLVRAAGSRRSRTTTRRSTAGSPTASSTSRTTASTATSRPGTATASPTTGAARRARSATITYAELLADVQRFANALKDRGIGKGDVVGIYLPMIPEVVVAMLACARIGAPHNVVFGGFSRRVGARAHGVLRREGADHRRRRRGARARPRRSRPRSTSVMGDARSTSRRSSSSATPATTCEMREGRDVWCARGAGGRRRRSARPSRSTPSTRSSSSTPRARPRSRRASCTRPAAT